MKLNFFLFDEIYYLFIYKTALTIAVDGRYINLIKLLLSYEKLAVNIMNILYTNFFIEFKTNIKCHSKSNS